MNNTTEKDFLYRGNKYVNSNKVVLDKAYIIKKRLSVIVSTLIFLVILSFGLLAIHLLFSPKVTVDNVSYSVTIMDNKSLDIGDNILFSYKDEISVEDTLKMYSRVFYVGEIGKVITLPHGINKYTGKQIEQDKILVECLSSGCKGNTQEINISSIFGKVS